MRACPSCGSGNQDDARFCASCGTTLFEPCPSCGAPVPEGARFCPTCGHALVEAAPVEERKLVTVLFTDLAESTALGERLDPERLKEVMNAYFQAMREEIEAEGGTVEKFIGDAIMAAFGVPAAHEDDAARALRAALRLRRRLGDLNEQLRAQHGVELEIRSGVNTGYVVAVTDPRPGEAMVTGDAVNVAARLQGAAAPGQTFVSERVARAAPGFAFEPVGPLELRGKREPIVALRLLADAPILERGVPGLHAPMVGRDAEMELLRSLFDRVVTERRPHLVTIYGDPGVGKSRLVREFADAVEASTSTPLVVRGRCLPYGEGVTYWALAEILKALAGVLDTDPPESALEKVRKLAHDVLGPEVSDDPDRATSALALTVGLNDPAFDLGGLGPEEVRAAIHGAWRSFFSGVAADRPVVAVVEDIHWADPALLDLLDDLAAHAAGPLLLVCPSRPELTGTRPAWGGGRRNFSSISLEPLTREDSDTLIGFLLQVEDLPTALHERIVAKAEGNPFFLEEIVRRLIDEGAIVREADRWRATETISDFDVPDSVQAVLAARIDLLEPEEKRALQMAAVVGRVFWLGPVARLLGTEPASLRDVVARLEERELVVSRLGSTMAGDRELIFKHILTRDVAYESLPRRERSRVHAEVADWIEDMAGERRGEFIELLAHHSLQAFRSAADGDREVADATRRHAFEDLLTAAGDARRKALIGRAHRFVDEASELAESPQERARALEARASTYWEDAQGDLTWETYSRAIELRLAEVPEDRAGIAWATARAVETPTRGPGSMTGRVDEADVRRYIDIGLEHAGPGDSVERVRLLTARAFWAFAYPEVLRDEDYPTLEAAGEEAAAMALRLDDPVRASAALDALLSLHLSRSSWITAEPVMERRLALADRITNAAEISDIFSVASWHEFHRGRYRAALAYADEGIRRSGAQKSSWRLHLHAWRGVAATRLGDWDEALVDADAAAEILGDRFERPPGYARRLHGAVAWIGEMRRDPQLADRFLGILEKEAGPDRETRFYGAIAWVALVFGLRGRFEEARVVLDDEESRPFQGNLGLVLEARCDLVAMAEQWDAAAALARRSRDHAQEVGLDALPAFADRLEGRAAIAAGDIEPAVELLARASETFGRLEARWERAFTDVFLAEALAASGDRDRSRAVLSGAAAVFDELRSAREIETARALAERIG